MDTNWWSRQLFLSLLAELLLVGLESSTRTVVGHNISLSPLAEISQGRGKHPTAASSSAPLGRGSCRRPTSWWACPFSPWRGPIPPGLTCVLHWWCQHCCPLPVSLGIAITSKSFCVCLYLIPKITVYSNSGPHKQHVSAVPQAEPEAENVLLTIISFPAPVRCARRTWKLPSISFQRYS